MADEKTNKVFAAGFYYDNPSENAPTFVVGKISVKVADAVAFLNAHENNAGYVNLDILMPIEGSRPYLALNTWKPEKPDSLKEQIEENVATWGDASKVDDEEEENVVPF